MRPYLHGICWVTSNGSEFIGEAWAYQLWFNYKRKNKWRGRKPPLEIFQEVPHG